MSLRKVSIKMLVKDELVRDIVSYLLDAPHEWIEISVGNKTEKGKR